MEFLPELVGLSVLVLLVVLLIVLIVSRQRALTHRVGSFVCAVRAASQPAGPWVDGVAQYGARHLRWWRAISLAPRPALVWPRDGLEIVERVVLDEVDELGRPLVRALVRVGGESFEIQLSSAPYSGLVSWLEAGPRRVGMSG